MFSGSSLPQPPSAFSRLATIIICIILSFLFYLHYQLHQLILTFSQPKKCLWAILPAKVPPVFLFVTTGQASTNIRNIYIKIIFSCASEIREMQVWAVSSRPLSSSSSLDHNIIFSLFPPWSLQPGHSIPSPFKVSLVTSLALPYQYHRTSPHLTYVGVACCRALEPNHTCFYMPNVCKCTFCIFLHIFVHFPYLWTFVQIWV